MDPMIMAMDYMIVGMTVCGKYDYLWKKLMIIFAPDFLPYFFRMNFFFFGADKIFNTSSSVILLSSTHFGIG